MADESRYAVPASRHRVEQTIDHSRFITTIARAASPEEAQAFVREMNAEFSDATHNCWAYVAGPPGSTSRIGMSDAGEPHGTAGRPMLTVLLHSGIGEIAAVVTRYYGGVKLGTGGLVKAYGGSVQQALASLPRAERVEWAAMRVAAGYASVTVVRQLAAAHDAVIDAEEFAADVRYTMRVPRPQADSLRAALMDATRGEARIEIEGSS